MKRILFYITAALLWLFVSYVDIVVGGYSGWNMLRLIFAATIQFMGRLRRPFYLRWIQTSDV